MVRNCVDGRLALRVAPWLGVQLEMRYDSTMTTGQAGKIARQIACDGVLYEPRIFFEKFAFSATPGATPVRSGEETYKNGQKAPIRITHLTAFVEQGEPQSPEVSPVQGDERLIARYGLRVLKNDDYYQSPDFIPLPLWHNVTTAPPRPVADHVSGWRYGRVNRAGARDGFPFVLGSRDSMVVRVQLQAYTSDTRVGVSFYGTGRLSKRPYMFASETVLDDTTQVLLDPNDYRNTSGEPIDIEGQSCYCRLNGQGAVAAAIRNLRLSIKQMGNGTGRQWEDGPIDSASSDTFCPAPLWGSSVGRAVVHRLGGDGWIWEPGQGVTMEMTSLDTTRSVAETVWVACLGHYIAT